MFVYLSKKIAIPNGIPLKCIAWDKENGYLACGGDDGLLKIVRLDSNKNAVNSSGQVQSNLSANQTLEGHNGSVSIAVWNETSQKLTTSDQNGLIIVWVFFKGTWHEEMINNRNKSVVTGMTWNGDGQKICIVYEDGAVIVGSVDGNRLWGRDLKNVQLSHVDWSPDSKMILFGLMNGEVHIYDSGGTFIMKLNVEAPCSLIALKWFKYSIYPENPSLAILFSNGKLQLMKSDQDENPIVVETQLKPVDCQWNHDGTILAIAGHSSDTNPSPTQNTINFYSPQGKLIRTMKLPGHQITGLSWEGFSLRLAFAIDSFIYLAQVKHDYMWTCFSNTLVYHFHKRNKPESYVMFWDTKNNERYVKQVRQFIGTASCGDHCVLATRLDDEEIQISTQCDFGLILCNALGTPVDSKYVSLEPRLVAMTSSHVVTASGKSFMLWHYRTPRSQTTIDITGIKRENKEKIYSIETFLSGEHSLSCVTARDNVLIFGTDTRNLLGFNLSSSAVQYVGDIQLSFEPTKMSLNSNCTKLAILDQNGVLHILQLEVDGASFTLGSILSFERRDVWDLCWAMDNPELFALMEKTRMYIFRSLEPEEPVVCSAYLCHFKDLEIFAVSLGDVLKDPENPSKEDLVAMETKSLRDTRHLLEKVGTNEAYQFVEENSHPRLWRLLAESALQQYDLQAAESAFVRCADFASLQLLHRLKNLPAGSGIIKAEVAAYFHKFDEAESIYLENDRRDLAMALRRKLGDWARVSELQNVATTTDMENKSTYNQMGNFFCDRHQYAQASRYYKQAENNEKLVDCYYNMEDYENLEKLIDLLDERDPLIPKIAAMFTSVGLCQQAVQCYLKCNQMKSALDTCVTLHQWNMAVELSRQIQAPEIASRLVSHADRLLEHGKISDAVELFRKANCHREAANLLFQVGEQAIKKWNDPLKIKKLFVLAALLTEEAKNVTTQNSLTMERVSKFLDAPWRPAEAWHYFILAQQQFQQGKLVAVMATTIKLQDYTDILDEETVFSMLALASALNKCFNVCSKAFTCLESIPSLNPADRENYSLLALEIFTKYPPKDGRSSKIECPHCSTDIQDWSNSCPECNNRFASCVATGRPLMDTSLIWSCRVCKHSAAEHDVVTRNSCPLCHSSI
ncbi:hypothetical protein GHT06_014747 [Daphnia sinensis]|uniref:WD repeat-containing protein 55 homolog n=1 Tax=Daphnia sinensis TaxID=1820382 RepID=A0AAD5KRF8_9CRUS|nr:hypothetical protein GHT06_014747 [Daphnia sinensis]